jgi:hypothetical protein
VIARLSAVLYEDKPVAECGKIIATVATIETTGGLP